MPTTFEYVPIFPASVNGIIRLILTGINTKHAAENTDRGRLYGVISAPFTLNLYSDAARSAAVAQGDLAAGVWGDLTALNASGVTGRVYPAANVAVDTPFVAVPTFAVDRDVFLSVNAAAAMPGYDPTDGLAAFHAEAVRQILTIHLPARLPNLYGGSGLSSYIPQGPGAPPPALPDLTRLANVDQLRSIQSQLVKFLSADQANHVEEFRNMATAAAARVDALLGELDLSNVTDETASGDVGNTISVTTFNRG
jgi:hypothetical protein